jgi:hypothetical protein
MKRSASATFYSPPAFIQCPFLVRVPICPSIGRVASGAWYSSGLKRPRLVDQPEIGARAAQPDLGPQGKRHTLFDASQPPRLPVSVGEVEMGGAHRQAGAFGRQEIGQGLDLVGSEPVSKRRFAAKQEAEGADVDPPAILREYRDISIVDGKVIGAPAAGLTRRSPRSA